MTRPITDIGDGARSFLLRARWPLEQPLTTHARVAVDVISAYLPWDATGRHVYRIRPGESQPIAPDLPLETTPIRRMAQAYQIDATAWILVARLPAGHLLHLSPERTLAHRPPVLVYVTTVGSAIAAGYISLADQPTPRHLRLGAGSHQMELYAQPLESQSIAEEGLRLVRVLPYFFSAP
jgi:hypothetical protein